MMHSGNSRQLEHTGNENGKAAVTATGALNDSITCAPGCVIMIVESGVFPSISIM